MYDLIWCCFSGLSFWSDASSCSPRVCVCVCVFVSLTLICCTDSLCQKRCIRWVISCNPLAPAIQSGNIGKCINFIKLWNPCSMGFVVPGRSRKNVHVHIARSCYCITEVDMGSTLQFQEAQVDEIVSKEWWMIGIASDYLIICHGSHGPLIYRQEWWVHISSEP